MGCHPLADYDPSSKNIDREAMEQYIPRYFQQRLTLNHLYTQPAPNQIVEHIKLDDGSVNNLKLSGINYKTLSEDRCGQLFATTQRLLLLLHYHNLILPSEFYPAASSTS